MEYYIEIAQTDIDPDTSLSLQEIIRLRVKDEAEGIQLVRMNAQNFPADRYTMNFIEHCPEDLAASRTTDIRSKI